MIEAPGDSPRALPVTRVAPCGFPFPAPPTGQRGTRMKDVSARGRGRLVPFVLVPLALLTTVRVGHAVSPDAAGRMHAGVEHAVTEMTNVLSGLRLFAAPATAVKREA